MFASKQRMYQLMFARQSDYSADSTPDTCGAVVRNIPWLATQERQGLR